MLLGAGLGAASLSLVLELWRGGNTSALSQGISAARRLVTSVGSFGKRGGTWRPSRSDAKIVEVNRQI